MAKGTVDKFKDPPGYGFIKPDIKGKDVFVHYSGIEGHGFKTLTPGDRVEFETEIGKKDRLQATNVRKI